LRRRREAGEQELLGQAWGRGRSAFAGTCWACSPGAYAAAPGG